MCVCVCVCVWWDEEHRAPWKQLGWSVLPVHFSAFSPRSQKTPFFLQNSSSLLICEDQDSWPSHSLSSKSGPSALSEGREQHQMG